MNTPNILFIMADQMTPFLMGAYGNSKVLTPNLNRLVEEGVRFDNAYSTCPVCVPARASIASGQYVSDIDCWDNGSPFSSQIPTYAHYLTNEGYNVVASGKMHFIGSDQLHGFRTRFTTDIVPVDFRLSPVLIDAEKVKFKRGGHAFTYALPTIGVRAYTNQLKFDEETHFRALEYILSEEHEKPFLLKVSYSHPHEPFEVTQEMWDEYENISVDLPKISDDLEKHYSVMDEWLNKFHGVKEAENLLDEKSLTTLRKSYCAMVTYVDKKIGQLLKALGQKGLKNNTVIVFTSDHGDMLAEKGMVQKRSFYDWSSKVPLIVQFPDNLYKSTIVQTPVSLIDIAPSFLQWAGINQPENWEGIPLESTINNEKKDRTVFSEFHTQGVLSQCFMARQSDWKYIYIHNYDEQLFNLKDDPEELENLAGKKECQEIKTKLKQEILGRFNPDDISKKIKKILPERWVIQNANFRNHTHWNFQTEFDADKLYLRGDI